MQIDRTFHLTGICAPNRFRQQIRSCIRASGSHMADNPKIDSRYVAVGLALGIAIGAGLGVAFGNLALGIGPGVAIGVALGVAMSQAKNAACDSKQPPERHGSD
jgi:hypothetical protein